jgi:CBS domain-containing protein
MTIHDPTLSHVRVSDVMHTGILTTDSSTELRVVAGLMATQRVHAVAVTELGNVSRPFAFITVAEIAAAAADAAYETAGEAATTEITTVVSTDSVEDSARLMVEHAVDHLIVIDAASGHPCGVLSGLDIAAAYANS